MNFTAHTEGVRQNDAAWFVVLKNEGIETKNVNSIKAKSQLIINQ